MKIFVNENTDYLIKDIRKYVKNTNESQTNIDTLDLCHMLGKIEYLEEKKRSLEINVLVKNKELERLNNIITELENYIQECLTKIENDREWYKFICPDIEEAIEINKLSISGTMLEFSKSGSKYAYKNSLDKLKELKENNNERRF